jgi:hypothetical protein
MVGELFMPLLTAGAVFVEEKLAGLRWETAGKVAKVAATAYPVVVGIIIIPLCLPILPVDLFQAYATTFKFLVPPLVESNGVAWSTSVVLAGSLAWDELVQGVARVYDELPAEDRAVAGVYSDWYGLAGAIRLDGASIWSSACGQWKSDILSVGAGILLGRHAHHCWQNQSYACLV